MCKIKEAQIRKISKHSWKTQKKDLKKLKDILCSWGILNIVMMSVIFKLIYKWSVIPKKYQKYWLFYGVRQTDDKIHMEYMQ